MHKRTGILVAAGAAAILCVAAGAAGLIRKEQIEDAYVRITSGSMSGSLTVAHIRSSTGTNTIGNGLAVFPAGSGRTAGVFRMSGTNNRDITLGCLSSTPGDSSVIDIVNRLGSSVFQVNTALQTITTQNANSFTVSKELIVSGNASPAHLKSSTGTNTVGGNLQINGTGACAGNYTWGDANGDTGRLHGNTTIGTATTSNTCKLVGRLEGFVIPLVFSTTTETITGGGYGYYGAPRCNGSRGWVATGSGSVCAISGAYSSTTLPNAIEVRRNGTQVWSVSVEDSQSVAELYRRRGKDSAAFSRGDNIEVYFGAGVYNAAMTVLVIVDTWDDDGLEVN